MPNNFSANDSRLGKCREYINDILDVFSRYLRFVEDAVVKVIAGDSWSKNLIDVSTMELGKQYTDFGLIVRFVDSFSMAFHKDIESENGVYSSCMLITEKTNKSYSDRSIGFIMGMNLENMVVIDEEDTNFLHNDATSGMGDWSVADIMDGKYMIYSRTKTAHRAIDYDRFKALVNPDEVNEINQFIDKLATFLNACGEKPIYILCNDINLSKAYNGGREFFDALESKISNPKIVRRMHFNNNNKDRHFEYGDEYKRNCLIFDDIPDEIRKAYNPFDSCASAQILIKKEQKEVIR